jgi:four helix bundle protein
MPTTTKPRDLGERTFQFACDIVQFCRKLSSEPGVVRQIAWQLADAGTSIAANYEEAKGVYSCRDFVFKNCIVLKEARESRLWLRIILACSLAVDEEVRPLYDEANELVVSSRPASGPCAAQDIDKVFSFQFSVFKFQVFSFKFSV